MPGSAMAIWSVRTASSLSPCFFCILALIRWYTGWSRTYNIGSSSNWADNQALIKWYTGWSRTYNIGSSSNSGTPGGLVPTTQGVAVTVVHRVVSYLQHRQ